MTRNNTVSSIDIPIQMQPSEDQDQAKDPINYAILRDDGDTCKDKTLFLIIVITTMLGTLLFAIFYTIFGI